MLSQHINIKQLRPAAKNVRKVKSSKEADAELLASIESIGLLQNLVVIPMKDGLFEVIAGNRRLLALNSLVEQGKLSPAADIPCKVIDAEIAQETALSENVIRWNMHPADKFDAFSLLITEGYTPEKIAEHFGLALREVVKILKLGNVAPDLMRHFRDGKMPLESLMAFTITNDHKKQIEVWKSLSDYQRSHANTIKRMLTPGTMSGKDKIVQFVTLKKYKAAGGTFIEDFFEDGIFIENPDLINTLALEKLEKEAEKLRADSWGWVDVRLEAPDYNEKARFSKIEPSFKDAPSKLTEELEKLESESEEIAEKLEKIWEGDGEETSEEEELSARSEKIEKRISDIQESIASFAAFDGEEMNLAGCFVYIDYNGKLGVEKGLVKKSDAKKLPAAASTVSEPDDEKLFSQSLFDNLKKYRCEAAQCEIAKNSMIASNLLVFTLARRALEGGYSHSDIDIILTKHDALFNDEPTYASKELTALSKTLDRSWLKAKDGETQFIKFMELSSDAKAAILSYCVAISLKPTMLHEGNNPVELALSMTTGAVHEYWRPTYDNFLSKITKEKLIDIGTEIFGNDWVLTRRNMKKSALAKELSDAFANPSKHDARAADLLKVWMPEMMEFRPESVKKAKTKAA